MERHLLLFQMRSSQFIQKGDDKVHVHAGHNEQWLDLFRSHEGLDWRLFSVQRAPGINLKKAT